MPFHYYLAYGVKTSNGQGLNGMLVRAPTRLPDGTYQFFISEDAPKPVVTLALSDLKALPRGAVQATWAYTGETLVFEPLTIKDVQKNAAWLGVAPVDAASLENTAELSLLLHDMFVPDWYDDEYAPVAANPVTESLSLQALTESLELDYWLVEAREAEIGSVHYWASRNRWFKKIATGSWRMMDPPEEWQDDPVGLPKNTLNEHLGPDNRLTEERKALHKRIIDKRFEGVERVDNPVALITMGLPASGKSALSAHMGRDSGMVVLDPDEYRAELPEYQQAVAMKARNAASIVHREVSYINDEALERARSEDPLQPGKMYPVVFDGVGGNLEFYSNLIHTFKAKGYKVKLVYAHVGDTPELAGKDALKIRSEDRGMRTGRFSQQAQVDALHDILPANFAALSKLVDSASVYDTANLDSPKKLYAHRDGVAEGDPEWHLKQQ